MVSVAPQQALTFTGNLLSIDDCPTMASMPDFFTSLFGADTVQEGSNPFDTEFATLLNSVDLTSAHHHSSVNMSSSSASLAPSLSHAHPSSRQLGPNSRYAYSTLPSSMAHVPPVTTLTTNLPYLNPHLTGAPSHFLLRTFSPPESVHNSPVEWPYPSFLSSQHEKQVHSTLPFLETQSENAIHSSYGQATPPDDVSSIHATDVDSLLPSEKLSVPPHSARKGRRRRDSTPIITPALIPETDNGKNSTAKTPRRPRRTNRGRPSKLASSTASITQADALSLEEAKRAKFLERNRVAASKCRQKKKAWTHDIEVQARELQAAKREQEGLLDALYEERRSLKETLLKHARCGDEHVESYLANEARWVAGGGERGGQGQRSLGKWIQRKIQEEKANPGQAEAIAGGNTDLEDDDEEVED